MALIRFKSPTIGHNSYWDNGWVCEWLWWYQCCSSSGIWCYCSGFGPKVRHKPIHTPQHTRTHTHTHIYQWPAIFSYSPYLTWRDVQYLIAYTSNPDILIVGDLATNGAGLKFSHHIGFGAIDAEALVTRARHWINVPRQQMCTIYLDDTM